MKRRNVRFYTALWIELLASPIAADPGSRPVEAQLNQLKEQSDQTVPPEILEAGRKGTEQLIQSGFLKK